MPQEAAACKRRGNCANLSAIPQASTDFQFAMQRLVLSIPQAAISAQARGSVPPDRWDEGINAALNTQSALPGEVRMFVGEVPEGWEAFQKALPRAASLTSLQWLASSLSAPDSSPVTSSGPTRALAMCDGQHILQIGRPSAGLTDNPASAPIYVTDIVTQQTTQLQNFTVTLPALYESMADGRVLFAGGVRVTSGSPVTTCQVMDRHGVIEARASMPGPRFRCVSGKISDDELLVVGGVATGSPGSPGAGTSSVFKYTYSTNTWDTLPTFPVEVSSGSGVVITSGGVTLAVIGSRVYRLDYSTNTFSEIAPPFTDGVTSVQAHQAAYLKDGRAIMYCQYVESAVSKKPAVFLFDGISIARADIPPIGPYSYNSAVSHCAISTPIAVGVDRIIAIANSPGQASASGAVLADESQAFIMQRAIKYARKLP